MSIKEFPGARLVVASAILALGKRTEDRGMSSPKGKDSIPLDRYSLFKQNSGEMVL